MGSYITKEGMRALQAEAEQLWTVERPRVTHEVSEAAALGDRSENAEYIYGKKRLREIDRRLRFLAKRIDALTVVENHAGQEGRVYFGAFVTIEHEDGREVEYRLVGPDESDPKVGKLSIESPLGRVLMGKEAEDDVEFRTPRGASSARVAAIRYEYDD